MKNVRFWKPKLFTLQLLLENIGIKKACPCTERPFVYPELLFKQKLSQFLALIPRTHVTYGYSACVSGPCNTSPCTWRLFSVSPNQIQACFTQNPTDEPKCQGRTGAAEWPSWDLTRSSVVVMYGPTPHHPPKLRTAPACISKTTFCLFFQSVADSIGENMSLQRTGIV